MAVKSALRVFEIMECLAEVDDGLTVKELSDELRFPQSSTFNLVQTMVESGYLLQTADKRYKLGPKFIYIGTCALKSIDLPKEAKPYLEKLMNRVGETVFMAVLSGNELMYIAKVDSHRSIKTSAEIGSRKPLYCTGLGKALLTFIADDKREELLNRIEMKAITHKTITNRDEMLRQIEQFKKQGFAIDDEEGEEGLFCYAAPVYNANGEVEAAISVAGPKDRIRKNGDETVKHLLETSKAISERLGYFK